MECNDNKKGINCSMTHFEINLSRLVRWFRRRRNYAEVVIRFGRSSWCVPTHLWPPRRRPPQRATRTCRQKVAHCLKGCPHNSWSVNLEVPVELSMRTVHETHLFFFYLRIVYNVTHWRECIESITLFCRLTWFLKGFECYVRSNGYADLGGTV